MSKPATTFDLAAAKKQLAESLERSAKSAGQTIVKESLTVEMGNGLQVLTAALKRDALPTEKQMTTGFDLMYAYVSIDGQKALPAGYYRIRLAIPGFEKSGDVKVSFIDAAGKSVHSLTAKGKPRSFKPGTGGDGNIGSTPVPMICGPKRCLNIKRNGFLDWEWYCTDRDGKLINCFDSLP